MVLVGVGSGIEGLRTYVGTSLAVEWLRLHTSNAGDVSPSLVGELRFHMAHGTAPNPPKKFKKREEESGENQST